MTSLTRHHIRSVEDEIRELRDALSQSMGVLQQIIDPDKFNTTSQHVWAHAVMAEAKARALLQGRREL